MNTAETITGMNPDVRADLDAAAEHAATGKPLDPEIASRIRQRADRIREEIRKKRGVQNIGVQIIREMRGELSEA